MLSLTRVFLYNWNSFPYHLLEIERPYFSIQDAAVWQTMLDVFQLLLTADLTVLPPPSPPHPSYAALEFTDTSRAAHVTVGVGKAASPPCFFTIPAPLDTTWFLPEPDGPARSIAEFQDYLQTYPDVHCDDQVAAYRVHIQEVLGYLPPRFAPLFTRLLRSDPPEQMRVFVSQWMLEDRPIALEALQRIAEPYAQLSHEARIVEEKLIAIHQIVARQEQLRLLRRTFAEHTVLVALLRREVSTRQLMAGQNEIARLNEAIAQAEQEQANLYAAMQEQRATLFETELQWRQTDERKRYDEIQREIKQATSDAMIIHAHWLALLHDLKQEEAMLHPLLEATLPTAIIEKTKRKGTGPLEKLLGTEEYRTLRALLYTILACEPDKPPPRRLARQIESVIPILDTALAHMQEISFQLREHIQTLRNRAKVVEHKRELLRLGAADYPEPIERICTLLTHLLGERPPLLCEVLDIPDAQWQDAVEAMLGPLRFMVLVQPAYAAIARQVIHRAYMNEHLTDVGVLDISAALHHRQLILPDSLAHQVKTDFPALQSYLHAVLGDIIACHTVEEVSKHRRAITPNLEYYAAWSLRVLPLDTARPWYIGARGRQSRIKTLEQEFQEISHALVEATRHLNGINSLLIRLKRVQELVAIRQRLDAPLDQTPLQEKIAYLISQQQSLEKHEMQGIPQHIEELKGSIAEKENRTYQLTASIASWETRIEQLTSALQKTQEQLSDEEQEAQAVEVRFPEVVSEAYEKLAHYFPTPSTQSSHEWHADDDLLLATTIRQMDRAARDCETKLGEEMQWLIQEVATYHARYHLATPPATGHLFDLDDERYAAEEQRLLADELPHYRDAIEQAQQRALEGLREAIVRPLYERIVTARQHIERFNEVLLRLELAGERYRFWVQPEASLLPFYHVVMGYPEWEREVSAPSSSGPEQQSWYLKHKPAIDRFYQVLTHPPQTEAEYQEREKLLDYRNYLQFAVEIHRANGGVMQVNPFAESPSPTAESFLPLYLTIAAAFAPIYRINEHRKRSTIRLLVFGKPLASMKPAHYEPILETIERLGLQMIIPNAEEKEGTRLGTGE